MPVRPWLLYRRRDVAVSAVVPTSHMLSVTLIVTPGGTISSMRSGTSAGRSIPSASAAIDRERFGPLRWIIHLAA